MEGGGGSVGEGKECEGEREKRKGGNRDMQLCTRAADIILSLSYIIMISLMNRYQVLVHEHGHFTHRYLLKLANLYTNTQCRYETVFLMVYTHTHWKMIMNTKLRDTL